MSGSSQRTRPFYDYDSCKWMCGPTTSSFMCCGTPGEQAPFGAVDVNSLPNSPTQGDPTNFMGEAPILGGCYVNAAHPYMDVRARTVKQGAVDQPINRKGEKVHIEYAYISQKGFHPSKVNLVWRNQDCCDVLERFLERDDTLFVGVFDGHGAVGEGERAAAVALEELPRVITEGFRANGYLPKSVLVDAFKRTSDKLCRELLSETGCTGLAAVLCGPDIHLAHCGDVRAILGKNEPDGAPTVAVMTTDHRAAHRGERERILSEHPNVEVLTFAMKDGSAPVTTHFTNGYGNRNSSGGGVSDGGGEEGSQMNPDPPRVWVKGHSFPGCSYTRSMGDSGAKGWGIVAQPEITTYRLAADDRYIVFCSDGITEFLSNEDIIALCERNERPLDACEDMVQTAFSWFMDDDGWADDLSVVVMKITWPSHLSRSASGKLGSNSILGGHGQRAACAQQ